MTLVVVAGPNVGPLEVRGGDNFSVFIGPDNF
jgi:hypothetical protein